MIFHIIPDVGYFLQKDGTMYYSKDGINWEEISIPKSSDFRGEVMSIFCENSIYLKNRILDNEFVLDHEGWPCQTLIADIYCRKCDTKLGKITSTYPCSNANDIHVEVPNNCPKCSNQIRINKNVEVVER